MAYKGNTEWNDSFTEQQDKWGYINNMRWTKRQDAIAFSQKMNLPVDFDDKHIPCGHWHKQGEAITSQQMWIPHSCWQSIDLYVSGSETFVFMPMWLDLTPMGMLALVDDTAGRVYIEDTGMVDYSDQWIWSMVEWDTDITWPQYMTAEVVTDSYFAAMATNWAADDNSTYIWIYRNGAASRKMIFQVDDDHLDYLYYNYGGRFVMNASGDIVVSLDGEDTINQTAGTIVMVSHNFGATWAQKEVFSFDTSADTLIFAESNVIEDTNGTLWLTAGYKKILPLPTVYKILLYKSLDQGETWSYVNEIVCVNGDASTPRFCIDGTDLYFILRISKQVYRSTNGGVTINLIATRPNYIYGIEINSGTICIVEYISNTSELITRSTDNGASWATVKTLTVGAGYDNLWSINRFRHRGNTWVYTSWAFIKNDILFYLISTDDGLTWADRLSTVTYVEDIAYVDKYSGSSITDEPQVWGLP